MSRAANIAIKEEILVAIHAQDTWPRTEMNHFTWV